MSIISDTKRFLSQAEKEGAFSIAPHTNISEAQTSVETLGMDSILAAVTDPSTTTDKFIVSKCNMGDLQKKYILHILTPIGNDSETPKVLSSYERKCVVCKKKVDNEETILTWEIMDFCSEYCLCM